METNPRERTSIDLTHNAPNLSRNNYLNRGRSPRRPTRRENQEGRFDTTEVWSPSRARHHGVFSEALQTSGLARSETEISGSNVPSSSLASLVSLANRQQTVTDSLSGGQNVSYTSQSTSDTNNAEERINITRINKSESHTTQPLSVTSSQGSHCASVSSGQTTSHGGSRGGSSYSRGSASGDLVSSGIAAALLGSRVGTTLSIESALRDGHLPSSSSSRRDNSSSNSHTTASSDTPSNNDTPSTISTSINSNISAATQSSSSSIASALLGNSAPPQRRLSSLSANSDPGLVRTESPQDDTVFGVSLRRGLTNNQPSAVFNPNVRSLVTSRPPIRRLSVQATFEPNAAVESAMAAAQQQQQQRRRGRRSSSDEEEAEHGVEEQDGEERSSVWREVLKLLSRLEDVSRRPG